VQVPLDAAQVELWFQRHCVSGTDAVDSQDGRNYWFAVTRVGLPVPQPSVEGRPAAEVQHGAIRVVADAATKQRVPTGAVGSRLVTRLTVTAAAGDAVAATAAWADVHVFDGADQLAHATTVPLVPQDGAFGWDGAVYEGSGGGSGIGVTLRPDAHLVQYRLYAEVHGRLVTDGLLQLTVPADYERTARPWS
jgi:hypothetical protein